MLEIISEKNETNDKTKAYMKLIQSDIMSLIEKEREDKKTEAEERGEDPETVDLTKEEINQLIEEYIESYNQDLLFEGLNPMEQKRDLTACLILENLYSQNMGWFERIAKTSANKKSAEDKKTNNIMERFAIDAEKNKKLEADEKIFFENFGNSVSKDVYHKMIDIICEIYSTSSRFTLAGLAKAVSGKRAEIETEISLPRIQEYLSFLKYYGFLDVQVENINEYFDKIGASELKFYVNNPLSEEYLYKGRDITDVEELLNLEKAGRKINRNYVFDHNVGIMDIFEDEELLRLLFQDPEFAKLRKRDFKDPKIYEAEKQSRDRDCLADNLILLETAYGFQYGTQRNRLSAALNMIKFGNLWDVITSGDKNAIDKISDVEIENIKRRVEKIEEVFDDKKIERAIISGKDEEEIEALINSNVTPAKKGSYTKTLKKYGFYQEGQTDKPTLVKDAISLIPDINNFENTVANFYEVLYRTLARFRDKGEKVNLVKDTEIDPDFRDIVNDSNVALLNNKMMIGPLIVALNPKITEHVFGDQTLEECTDPQTRKLTEEYTNLASLVLMPNNPWLKKKALELYEKNPENPVISYLAGMPMKEKIQNPEAPENPEDPDDDRDDL